MLIYKKNSVSAIKKEDTPEFKQYMQSYLYKEIISKEIDWMYSNRKKKVWKKVSHREPLFKVSPDGKWLIIPTGLLMILPTPVNMSIEIKVSKDAVESKLNDPVIDPDAIKHSLPQYDLRDDQVSAVTKALVNKRGIIQMPTGSGKSSIIASVLKMLYDANPTTLKALVLAPTLVTCDNIYDTLVASGLPCKMYKDDYKLESPIIVAHSDSLLSAKGIARTDLSKINVRIMDELQHAECDSWRSVCEKTADSQYSLGFSAKVIDNQNVLSKNVSTYSYGEAVIVGLTGPVIMHVSPSLYIEKNILATPVVFQVYEDMSRYVNANEGDWHVISKKGLMNPTRTTKVATLADMFSKYGRKVLILVNYKKHAYEIGKLLANLGVTSFGLSFGGNQGYIYRHHSTMINGDIDVDYESSGEVNHLFNDNKVSIMIATSHMDEGADVKSLDVCIMAGGGKKDRRILQRVGRALRITKTGKYAYVVDFSDSNNGVLSYHANERMKIYESDLGIINERMNKSIPISKVESKFCELEGIDPE